MLCECSVIELQPFVVIISQVDVTTVVRLIVQNYCRMKKLCQ